MKLKEFKIDLGGEFPAKSKAVRRHAIYLGYTDVSVEASNEKRYVGFSRLQMVISTSSHERFFGWDYEEISAERFLELTKEDVIEKEPDLYYRYRIWLKIGTILETENFLMEKHGKFYSASGSLFCCESNVVKCERIGEGVAKVLGQA